MELSFWVVVGLLLVGVAVALGWSGRRREASLAVACAVALTVALVAFG